MEPDRPSVVQVPCCDCWCKFLVPADDPMLPDGPFICPQCLGDDIDPSSFPPVEPKTNEIECSVCGRGCAVPPDVTIPFVCSSCKNEQEDD